MLIRIRFAKTLEVKSYNSSFPTYFNFFYLIIYFKVNIIKDAKQTNKNFS